MIVDTSAPVAVLREEAEASQFVEVMVRAPNLVMSAASWTELEPALVP